MISVLCVDDDAAHLSLEKQWLEEPGAMTVTTALSAPEALREMEAGRFDAVVADHQMPGMDGIKLLKEVRGANPTLPFILFTGNGREDVVIEAFNDDVDFYLQKTGDPDTQFAQLGDTIKNAVKLGAVWKAFHDSESRYRRLFETARDGILILDAESGEIRDANPFLLTLLGYTLDEMQGKKLWEIGLIQDKALAEQAAAILKEAGYIRYEDLPLVTKDGQVIDVEFVSNVYREVNENVIQCNIRDISERKRIEMALKKSEIKYRQILDVLNEGIWSIDKDSGTTFVNSLMAEMMGYSVDEMLGRSIFSFMDEPGKQITLKKIEHLQRGMKEKHDFEFLQKDGTRICTHLEMVPIIDKDGSYKGAIVGAQDITECKAAEETLKTFSNDLERKVAVRTSDLTDINLNLMTEIDIRLDAEKQFTKRMGEKEVLLREVHHRVKNNLQIIISLLNLQSRYIKDEIALTAFRESQNRVRAMALVHEKLYQSSDLTSIDLNNYLKFLGDHLFKFMDMSGKGITLTMDIQDIFLTIDAAVPIGLIINELISNSLKYAFPNGGIGEITLAIARQDHTLTILFKDNGIGIPEDFDWRNVESLGLRLVCSLVEQLDGTIELDRRAGTAFTIIVEEKV